LSASEGPDPLQQVERAFAENPDDARAFETLEERWFLSGSWHALVSLYRARLAAPSLSGDPQAAAAILLRLAQVLEERCLDIDGALEAYTDAARRLPQFHPALRGLRRIHTERRQWDLVLQIAELEAQVPMQPYQKAGFLTELGELWLTELGDLGEAKACFRRALKTDSTHQGALSGYARVLDRLGRHEDSAKIWNHLIAQMRGPERAEPLVALGHLYATELDAPERAIECYRRALGDDPRCKPALEALIVQAAAHEKWPLLADLYERRFELASGARKRTGIALEAAELQLERQGNEGAARAWLERARQLCPDDVEVLQAQADLERRSGEPQALLDALERLIRTAAHEAPASALLEAASLHGELGRSDAALELLRRAYQRSPENPLVAEALLEALSHEGHHGERAELLEERAAQAMADPETQAAVLAELGRVHEQDLADPVAARDAYERALACDPRGESALPIERLEALYRKSEDWSELATLYERCAQHEDPAVALRHSRALAQLLFTEIGDLERAREAFEAVLALDPTDAAAFGGLRALAERADDREALFALCEREAEVSSDKARLGELATVLAEGYEAQGRLGEALAWAERRVACAPSEAGALREVARLCAANELPDAHLAALERLQQLLSGSEQARVRRTLAALYEDAGREAEAVDTYEAALASDPDDVDTMQALFRHYSARGSSEDILRLSRRLSVLLPKAERVPYLRALEAGLPKGIAQVDERLDVLGQLAELQEIGSDAWRDAWSERESLLATLGRFEALADSKAARRAHLEAGSPEARALDLERARLAIDRLGDFEGACEILRSLRERCRGDAEIDALFESALRQGGDPAALAALLAEYEEASPDPEEREGFRFERAALLAGLEAQRERAVELYEELCSSRSEARRERAGHALTSLLEQIGDDELLRVHLEHELAREELPLRRAAELHARVATLYRSEDASGVTAAPHLRRAAELDDRDPQRWRAYADLCLHLGDDHERLRALERELALQPELARELEVRGEAARRRSERGDCAGATTHYERMLELEPGHEVATHFLADAHRKAERNHELLALLEARLRALERGSREPDPHTELRLEIAALRAHHAGDLEAAIAVLEPALEIEGATARIVDPLADLYERFGAVAELIDLCRQAVDAAETPETRGHWRRELARALRADGDPVAAREAFESVLEDRPQDSEAILALEALYRELRQHDRLASLLCTQLGRSPDRQTEIRFELVDLFDGPLERPEEAFAQLERLLEASPAHRGALTRACSIAKRLGRHSDLLRLLEAQRPHLQSLEDRVDLELERADLMAGPLAGAAEATEAYREVLALDSANRHASEGLCLQLERQSRWPELLQALEARLDSAEAPAVMERALALCDQHLAELPDGGEAVRLAWLERWRGIEPSNAEISARIAELQLAAGRPAAALRALDAQVEQTRDPAALAGLHEERARLCEEWNASAARTAAAYEDLLSVDSAHLPALRALDALYEELGRPRERARVLEARLAHDPEAAEATRRSAAWIYAGPLSDPAAAIRVLEKGAASLEEASPEALFDLCNAYELVGDRSAWVRAATRRAESGRMPEAEAAALRMDLARTETDLGHWDAALGHLRVASEAGDPQIARAAERALLELLGRVGSAAELASRLRRLLEREPESPAQWMRLAELEEHALCAPKQALLTYRNALTHGADPRASLSSVRRVAERLERWDEVASALQEELGHAPAHARPALLRRLGEVAWRKLGEGERALHAYEDALGMQNEDLESLHSLQELRESRRDFGEALDLFEREIELLGDGDPTRRRDLWLRIARGAGSEDRSTTYEARRAIAAYEAADEIAPLDASDQRTWAELLLQEGGSEHFGEVFARWCDDAGSGALSADHLRLALWLEQHGDEAGARERAVRACRAPGAAAPAFDARARLEECLGDTESAAESLVAAAGFLAAPAAAERRVRAAGLVERSDPSRALALLREAVDLDPSNVFAHAARARVALDRDEASEAETAAARVLDLVALGASTSRPNRGEALGDGVRLETALIGGQASLACARLASAADFFDEALRIDPAHRQALEARGQIHYEQGEIEQACALLSRWLELAPEGTEDENGRPFAVLGLGAEHAGDFDRALEYFDSAIARDPGEALAHAGAARIYETRGQSGELTAALDLWAESEADPTTRAEVRERCARTHREQGDFDTAEERLRAAIAASPERGSAPIALCELLLTEREGASDQVLEIVTDALDTVTAPHARAQLLIARARAHEARGARQPSAAAYADARRADPLCCDAAYGESRLLRELGQWPEAAAALVSFTDAHPEPTRTELAGVHHERARILAGPLEKMDEAINAYEQALAIDPGFQPAREPLADLLALLPDSRREALRHHRALLEQAPGRAQSWRALLRIARRQSGRKRGDIGLCVLRALGCASPDERDSAPERLEARIVHTPELETPTFEKARLLLEAASSEILDARAVAPDAFHPDPEETTPGLPFEVATREREGQLSTPALPQLTNTELGRLLQALVALGSDEPTLPDAPLESALESVIGRRTRRRLRKIVETLPDAAQLDLDFDAFRQELRSLAAALALDHSKLSLREALETLCDSGGEENRDSDLSARIDGSPEASALLRRIARHWGTEIARNV